MSFFMPGANCAIFGCSTSQKHKIAMFKVPEKDDEYNTNLRKTIRNFINVDKG